MVRPSKSFLFDLLESRLAKLRGEVGVDVGSADFKNRRMFQTARYYGLDRDMEMLKKGLVRHDNENTFAIWADLTRLEKLPQNSADVVVTTNTLSHLAAPDQKIAINFLCGLTAPSGYFLCEMSLDENFDELLSIIKSHFDLVQINYYRNPASRFYEWIFERDGDLGTHPIAGRRPFRLMAWLISRLEYLTCRFRAGNRHAFLICTGKPARAAQKFNLSNLILNGRIYAQ